MNAVTSNICESNVSKGKTFEGFAPERQTNPFLWVSSLCQEPE